MNVVVVAELKVKVKVKVEMKVKVSVVADVRTTRRVLYLTTHVTKMNLEDVYRTSTPKHSERLSCKETEHYSCNM